MDVEMEEARSQALDPADPQPPDPAQPEPEPQAQDQPQSQPEDQDQAPDQPQPPSTPTKDQCCQTEEQQPSSPTADKPSTSTGPAHNTPGCCVEPGDPPLLQQPLQTSKSGIQQIIDCFRSGTTQLKHILLKEVDTIFECKLCRSLFRGLPNLITHKEYYCLTRLPEPDGPSGDDQQTVAIKDLLEAIYPRKDRPDQVVRLEPIQTSSNAVFQYTSSEEELAQLAQYPQHTPLESRSHSPDHSPEHWGAEPAEQSDQADQADDHSRPGAEADTQRRSDAEDEGREEAAQPEEDESTSGVEDVTISCCLCGKDFNSRRSIRRHCRKMHRSKLEELRKFTETRTVPISLLSMVKGRPRTISKPTGKSCPVCFKAFATKANVRRHFDEVHRGLRRDTITPDIATRPGQPLSLEATPPRKSANSSPTRGNTTPTKAPATPPPQPKPPQPQYNLATRRCLLCKRKYNSQVILKRHMRIVHRIYNLKDNKSETTTTTTTATATTETTTNNNNNNSSSSSAPSNSVRVKEENVEPSDDPDSSPAPSPSNDTDRKDAFTQAKGTKLKEEEAEVPKTSGRTSGRPPKLSVGFDFKQLFCKLCKRQFSSRQNLTKHIELHTDGNDIFIKFYRCPLCRYESRRKRDVLRHVTVVHKKSSSYLAKIMPKLENRAVKRPAEVVLNTNSTTAKRAAVKEEVNGRHSPPSPPVTRKQDLLLSSPASSASTPVTRKQDRQQQDQVTSPPLTRKMDKQHQDSPASASHPPATRWQEAHQDTSSGTSEVRVTKNFSLHACDVCGRAFAKKLYLESHKRSHRNAAAAAAVSTPDTRTKGVSTRSKALLW